MNQRTMIAGLKAAAGPLLIIVLSIVAMVAFHRGIVLRDARFEHFAEPWQFLTRHLQIWDDTRGPGVPLQYFSPVMGTIQSFFAWIGLPVWLIGRLTLSIYLSIAGIGAWYLWRRIWPARSRWALLAGLLYAFNPYSVEAIMPSGLFLPVALLPWLIAFTYDGVRSATDGDWRRSLKFAAASALAVFSVGMLNTASLLFVLVPVALFGILLIFEGSATWRGLLKFGVPSAALTALVSAPTLLVLSLSSPTLSRNLGTTELPETVAKTSSSFESWRGLGKWLTYFGWGQGAETPSASTYLTNPVVIVATFVALALAIVALGWKRTPLRRTWGILLAGSVLVMIGAHSPAQSPIGSAFQWAFDSVTGAAAFRTTYKGGPIAVLAVAILATCGTMASLAWISDNVTNRNIRRVFTVGAVVVVFGSFVLSVSPFVQGTRIGDRLSVPVIPNYWEEAFTWFESVPETDRVLVLPASSETNYQWGPVNDTLFDAYMHPMVLTASIIPSTTGELADATMAFDRLITNFQIDPAAVTPILKWLGVRWVVVQNDLDVLATGIPIDPLAELRTAPGLSLAAQFGRDVNGYSMVDVFAVDSPTPDASYSSGPPSIVSGGPDSLYSLAANGLLRGRPTTFLPDLSQEQSAALVDQGAPVFVTDGSRRVASAVVSGSRTGTSPLMSADEQSIRPVLVLDPNDTSTQTVAEYGDATSISANRVGYSLDSWSIDTTAAAAFDGDSATSWWVSDVVGPVEETFVSVDLKEPTFVDRIVVTQADFGTARITGAQVEATGVDGRTYVTPIVFDRSVGSASVGAQVGSFKLRITETNGVGGKFGFQEVEVFGQGGLLGLQQWIRVPTDVERLGGAVTPTYAFARSGSEIESSILRREFVVPVSSSYRFTASISVPKSIDEATLDRSCRDWFSMDGVEGSARITSFDTQTRTAKLEGCEVTNLNAGTHRVAVLGTSTASFYSFGFMPMAGIAATDVAPVNSQRVSASEHTVSIPADAGWLSMLVPAHPGWSMNAQGRTADFLLMNGEMGWAVVQGDAVTATVTFRPQAMYRIAMVIGALSVLLCIVLLFWRRREPA